MLDGLFSEDDCVSTRHIEPSKFSIHSPPRPRYQCGLAGISNQGATCYLNSLLQTLLLTPEFRGNFSEFVNNYVISDMRQAKPEMLSKEQIHTTFHFGIPVTFVYYFNSLPTQFQSS